MKINLYSLKNEHVQSDIPYFHYILQLNNFGIMMTKDDKKNILSVPSNIIINSKNMYNHYICNITKKQLEFLKSKDKTIVRIIFTTLINKYETI
jgi:presenilin-like A22 family membrane protease